MDPRNNFSIYSHPGLRSTTPGQMTYTWSKNPVTSGTGRRGQVFNKLPTEYNVRSTGYRSSLSPTHQNSRPNPNSIQGNDFTSPLEGSIGTLTQSMRNYLNARNIEVNSVKFFFDIVGFSVLSTFLEKRFPSNLQASEQLGFGVFTFGFITSRSWGRAASKCWILIYIVGSLLRIGMGMSEMR